MPERRRRIYLVSVVLAGALIAYLAGTYLIGGQSALRDRNGTLAASTEQERGTLTILTLVDGRLAGGAAFRISPNPFTGGAEHTVSDGDSGTDASSVQGIITLGGIPDGTYSVIQLAGPEGQQRDITPRIVTITNGSSEAVTFGSSPTSSATDQSTGTGGFDDIHSITHTAKFECGTIRGAEGPLRPGHYDTDIGIVNKQGFPVKITWTAAANDNQAANAILRTLEAQTSTSIVCNDIRDVIGSGGDFVEGFVIIEVPVDPLVQASISGGTSVLGSSAQRLDVLDVQIFYTANALQELPHPILVDKITFIIRSNSTTESLPDSMIGKVLDITLRSELDELSDPVAKVKTYLSQNFNVTSQELSELSIEIKSIDVGVGTMIDDHAVSLAKVQPQAKAG